MDANQVQQTIALSTAMKLAQKTGNPELAKAFAQNASAVSGITAYDLEGPAKLLYPVITPLRNAIPRVSGKGGIQANWRAITGINTGRVSVGVGQGNRSGVTATTTKDYTAAYKTLGLEDYATFEADLAAQGFDDVKALTVEGLLRSLMIGEEQVLLGGNSTLALGTTATPSLSTSTTGGALAAATYSVICVALTLDGYLNSSVTGGVTGAVVRTNSDGSSDSYGGGAAQKSAAGSQVTTGSTSTISGTVAVKTGAVAYAWYWGTAGNELLGAVTTINSVVISAAATGTQNASALTGDNSQNALVHDGLISMCSQGGSGSYITNLATGTAGTGTPLTSDSAGGIVEIDVALKSFWDNYRLTPDTIWVNAQEALNISKKIVTGGTNAAQRFVFNSEQGVLAGGIMVRSYLNRFSITGAAEIPIRIHPNLPPGTILFTTTQLPYPLSNVANVLQVRERRSYYQIEWPMRSRKYEYGVYVDQVLQNYFPPAFGLITNIANG
jgi:hypothetical protein